MTRLQSRRLRRRGALLVLPAALVLAGCGTGTTGGNTAVTVTGKTLTVYLGQPTGGAQSEPARDVLAAEALAYHESGGKAGRYAVALKTLDGRKLSDNARTAIADKTAIAYLGELVPGTSEISVEIVNQQGLLEVSPLDTSAYLTQKVPGVSDSIDTFYPGHATYHETFARVVPNSGQEAKALVGEMQSEHVTSLSIADDGQRYGQTLAEEVRTAARTAGISLSASAGSAGAVFFGGSLTSASTRAAAIRFFDTAASQAPSAKLFAPSGLYDSSFAGALSAAAQKQLVVSSPGFAPGRLPAGAQSFVAAFRSAYHRAPAPQAVFGYEAMKALLSVITSAGANAGNRGVIVSAFRSLKRTGSALGDYTITGGDPSLAPFVFARVRGGTLVPFRAAQLNG